MGLLDWLLLPLSGSAQHHIEPWAYWHARSMVLGWCVLLPLGALVARYFKVLPRQRWPQQLDNKLWWHAHRALQWAGVLLMSVGAALAVGRAAGASPAAQLHGSLGWALVALGWLQVVYGLGRGSKGGPTDVHLRGDHYDMTPSRRRFERIHKGLGWLAVLAALVVAVLGLLVADAPRWMALALAIWWLLLAALAWRLQRQGRCIDTYQAIWGPDPRHPGNRIKPIGWGIRRPQA
ncbi:MAG: cytochrome b561 domain-containing protein [Proteobacteria bacterium]|nr:cytochrome b561 domain-containing protein [Pseudomonadota bacterium]